MSTSSSPLRSVCSPVRVRVRVRVRVAVPVPVKGGCGWVPRTRRIRQATVHKKLMRRRLLSQ